MAERQLPKLNVAGSIPVSRSIEINYISRQSGNNKQPVQQCGNGKGTLGDLWVECSDAAMNVTVSK